MKVFIIKKYTIVCLENCNLQNVLNVYEYFHYFRKYPPIIFVNTSLKKKNLE